jgi:hypothetical protein
MKSVFYSNPIEIGGNGFGQAPNDDLKNVEDEQKN